MLAAAIISSGLALSPIPQDHIWTSVLSPPFEHVEVAALRYRPDPADADVKHRPLATLNSGGGDCEDLAIATYHSLRLSGMPADQVFVMVGYLYPGGWHAVVAMRDSNGGWRFIDPTGRIHRDTMRPLFMVNERGSYLVTRTS